MNDRSKEFNEFFQETYTLFEKTTEYAKYLETLGDKVEITYINELRSVLFHLYSYLDKACEVDQQKFQENFFGAREHLYRAYYDTFSLICVLSIKKIKRYTDDFPHSVVYSIYPAYFNKIMLELTTVQTLISKIHSSKLLHEELSSKIDPQLTLSQKMKKNDGIVTALMNWDSELVALTSLFVEHHQKLIHEEKKEKSLELERERAYQLELEKLKKENSRFKINIWIVILIQIIGIGLTALVTYYILAPRTAELSKPIINKSSGNK